MSNPPPVSALAGEPAPVTPAAEPSSSQRRALVLVAAFALLHTYFVWGYTGLFWGDHGAWLHEVERFARGEVPYRDFQWDRPPLALWLIGGAARLAGTGLATVSAATAVLAALVLFAYQRFISRVAPGVMVPAVLAGLLFAAAYASRQGVPLPLGTYSPAVPVGFLFLLIGATAAARLLQEPTPGAALLVGLCAALGILSSGDLLLPALYLVGAAAVVLRRAGAAGAAGTAGRRPAARMLLAFTLTLLAGAAALAAEVGMANLPAALSSSLQADAPPPLITTLERLTVEVAATATLGLVGVAALWLTLALDDSRAGALFGGFMLVFLSACAVHVGMSVATYHSIAAEGLDRPLNPTVEVLAAALRAGRPPLGPSLGILDQRLAHHFFPATLPWVLLAALLIWWRRWADPALRGRALLLLGLCVATRLPRKLAGADWYEVLLEIPAYAIFLRLVTGTAVRQAQRCVSAALSLVILIGVYTYYNLGRGRLTRRHYAAAHTLRGTVRWPAEERADLESVRALLDSLDPSGNRPLFAFGATGGWNYFLARKNPSRATRWLLEAGSGGSRSSDAIRASRPPALLLDNVSAGPGPGLSPYDGVLWEPRRLPGARERSRFDDLARGCRAVPALPGPRLRIVIYDCGATPPDSSR